MLSEEDVRKELDREREVLRNLQRVIGSKYMTYERNKKALRDKEILKRQIKVLLFVLGEKGDD